MKKIFKVTMGIGLGLFVLALASCTGEDEPAIYELEEPTIESSVYLDSDDLTIRQPNNEIAEIIQTPQPTQTSQISPGISTIDFTEFGIGVGVVVHIYAPYNIIEGEIAFPEDNFSEINMGFWADIHIVEGMGDVLLRYRLDHRLAYILGVYIEDGVLNISSTHGISWQNSHLADRADRVIYLNADAIRNRVVNKR